MQLNRMIDHTILKADATLEDVDQVVREALKYEFASVCVNPYYCEHVASMLKGSKVKTCVVIGFPLGQMTTEAKVFEAKDAVKRGAQEVDMVQNIAALKDGRDDYVREEISRVKEAVGDRVLKVILETCLLTEEEQKRACELAVEAGADFVKTSTGFSTNGATTEAVELMAKTVGDRAKVKASGGIRTKEKALEMIEAGASRIGASSGVAFMK